jgi:hypothetical protein
MHILNENPQGSLILPINKLKIAQKTGMNMMKQTADYYALKLQVGFPFHIFFFFSFFGGGWGFGGVSKLVHNLISIYVQEQTSSTRRRRFPRFDLPEAYCTPEKEFATNLQQHRAASFRMAPSSSSKYTTTDSLANSRRSWP